MIGAGDAGAGRVELTAVVFSVLGRREVSGRPGTVLEGESGVNDPVGIAAMAALLTAGTTGGWGGRGWGG